MSLDIQNFDVVTDFAVGKYTFAKALNVLKSESENPSQQVLDLKKKKVSNQNQDSQQQKTGKKKREPQLDHPPIDIVRKLDLLAKVNDSESMTAGGGKKSATGLDVHDSIFHSIVLDDIQYHAAGGTMELGASKKVHPTPEPPQVKPQRLLPQNVKIASLRPPKIEPRVPLTGGQLQPRKEEKIREIIVPLGPDRMTDEDVKANLKHEYAVRYCEMLGIHPTVQNVSSILASQPLEKCHIRQVIHPGLGRGERKNFISIIPPSYSYALAKKSGIQKPIRDLDSDVLPFETLGGGKTAGEKNVVHQLHDPVTATGIKPPDPILGASEIAALGGEGKEDQPVGMLHQGPRFDFYKHRFVYPYCLESRFELDPNSHTAMKRAKRLASMKLKGDIAGMNDEEDDEPEAGCDPETKAILRRGLIFPDQMNPEEQRARTGEVSAHVRFSPENLKGPSGGVEVAVPQGSASFAAAALSKGLHLHDLMMRKQGAIPMTQSETRTFEDVLRDARPPAVTEEHIIALEAMLEDSGHCLADEEAPAKAPTDTAKASSSDDDYDPVADPEAATAAYLRRQRHKLQQKDKVAETHPDADSKSLNQRSTETPNAELETDQQQVNIKPPVPVTGEFFCAPPPLDGNSQRELDNFMPAVAAEIRTYQTQFVKDFPFQAFYPMNSTSQLAEVARRKQAVLSLEVSKCVASSLRFLAAAYLAPLTSVHRYNLASRRHSDTNEATQSTPQSAQQEVSRTVHGGEELYSLVSQKDSLFVRMYSDVLSLFSDFGSTFEGIAKDFGLIILLTRVAIETDIIGKCPYFSRSATGRNTLQKMDEIFMSVIDPANVLYHLAPIESTPLSLRVMHAKRAPGRMPPLLTTPITQVIIGRDSKAPSAKAIMRSQPTRIQDAVQRLEEHLTPGVRSQLMKLLSQGKFSCHGVVASTPTETPTREM